MLNSKFVWIKINVLSLSFVIFYRFIYLSTAEVFGPAPPGVTHKEYDRYNSGNPYAAAKVFDWYQHKRKFLK